MKFDLHKQVAFEHGLSKRFHVTPPHRVEVCGTRRAGDVTLTQRLITICELKRPRNPKPGPGDHVGCHVVAPDLPHPTPSKERAPESRRLPRGGTRPTESSHSFSNKGAVSLRTNWHIEAHFKWRTPRALFTLGTVCVAIAGLALATQASVSKESV